MKRESWSIIIACFFGAFVGGITALEIAARFEYGSYFWGIGALLGGIVAYFIVDFAQVRTGVLRAYNNVVNWQPNLLYWKAVIVNMTYMMSVTIYVVLFFSLPYSMIGVISGERVEMVVMSILIVSAIMLIIVLILSLLISLDELSRGENEGREWRYRLKLLRSIRRNLGHIETLNPVTATCFLAALLWRSLPKLHKIPRLLWNFVLTFVRYIHSERRTLCFIDAALGATVGYYFGSAVIGAVVGAILGVINYELVSVRWLKLSPTK